MAEIWILKRTRFKRAATRVVEPPGSRAPEADEVGMPRFEPLYHTWRAKSRAFRGSLQEALRRAARSDGGGLRQRMV